MLVFSFFLNFYFFHRYRYQEQELREFSEAIIQLKEDLKSENKKLQGIKHSKTIDVREIKFLEEQMRHLDKDEEDKEQSEIERRNKIQSLEETKYNLSSELENIKVQEESMENKQQEISKELEEQKESRKDHELMKAKLEANISEIRSVGKSKLAVFDPAAPKIAARIEEATRYVY